MGFVEGRSLATAQAAAAGTPMLPAQRYIHIAGATPSFPRRRTGDRGFAKCNNRGEPLRQDDSAWSCGGYVLADRTKKKFDLGRDGTITLHVSEDTKWLLIEFDVDKEGLTKAGVNGLIDALKKIRAKTVR
jgi:hypothetical protein